MRAPDNTNRVSIIGRTGSGKTQFGIWFLGQQIPGAWRGMPITIFDYKRDKLIAQLPAKEISINSKPPIDAGLYVVRPSPDTDDEAVMMYLSRVWDNGYHAIYFDEGYMIGNRNPAFRRLLTQGRSLHIPMVYLSQRPVYMDRFAFSEAEFFGMFTLNHADDALLARKMVPTYPNKGLGEYECYWYSVASDTGVILKPVPSAAEIVASIAAHYKRDELEQVSEEAPSNHKRFL